jgi:DNA-directed RNA polymerase specialized sigma24 family protein
MMGDERPRLGEEQRRWLAELHAAQFEPMLRIAVRALPQPSWANAEDVVQTVFAEAANRAACRPGERVGTGWLIKRLRSRIVDLRRRVCRQQRMLTALALADLAPSPDDVAIDRSSAAELLASIPDEDDRRTLALKLSGFSEAEIARRMTLPPGSRQVRDRLLRLRRRVSRQTAEQEGTPAI